MNHSNTNYSITDNYGSDTIEKNPIRRERERLGLSREELATRISVTSQAILRCEQGMYFLPCLDQYFLDRGYDLKEEFKSWQVSMRKSMGQHSGFELSELCTWLDSARKQHPLMFLRNKTSLSRVKFCRLFCLHPGIVTKFEQGGHLEVPDSIIEAFKDAEFYKECIDKFKESYALWKNKK